MGSNTGDKLTIDILLEALEYEATLGRLFLEYNTVKTVDTDEMISKYVYSKKYYFEYDPYKALWAEIPLLNLVSRLEAWIANQCLIIAREELSATIGDAEKYKLLLSKTLKIRKLKYLENVIKIVQVDMTDDNIFDKLDKTRPLWLPIRNGQLLNLITNQKRRRQINDYFTFEIDYQPAEKYSPFFINAMKNIMCNDEDRLKYFQKILGYCLTGDCSSQCFFIWYGVGSNGKSLILNLLAALLGPAYKPISKGVVINCGRSKSEAGTEILALKDLRVGSFSESSKCETLNEALIKTLSGGDKLTARGLYKDPIEFNVFLKLIICTNHRPEFDGSDFGLIRRLKLLQFDAKFTRKAKPDPLKNEFSIIENLEKTLIDCYMDEFFLFCVQGCALWWADKGFNIVPQEIKNQENNYIREQNSFKTWFDEFIIKTKDDESRLIRPQAYDHYKNYCNEQGYKALARRDMLEQLSNEAGPKKKSNGVEFHKGYKLVMQTAPPDCDFVDSPTTNRDNLDA